MFRNSALFILGAWSLAAQNQPAAIANPPELDPKLPRVLLIGDSISIGYTIPVRRLLAGQANVHRIPTNAGPSSNGAFSIENWLAKERWDVIHFNFGLHDIKLLEDGQPQVGIEAYRRYLTLVTARLKKTGAKLIYANTTPVPEAKVSPPRRPADVAAYNEAAAAIMKEHGIPVNDLYALALPQLEKIQQPANVHFTPEGYSVLAKQVASAIAARLPAK